MIGLKRGEIVSQHRTKPAAVRAAGNTGFDSFLRVVSVAQYRNEREPCGE
jgi:hypothetical protein